MATNSLLNTPKNSQEWTVWSFNNKQENTRIRQAIFSQSNGSINLPEYVLDPIDFNDESNFLSRNQQAHDDFNGALGLNGVDLEGVDLSDSKQLQSWIFLVWSEINIAQLQLGI